MRYVPLLLMLAGCAGPWVRPGSTQADLTRDTAECNYEADKAVAATASAVAAGITAGQLVVQCMKLKGWTR
jgi:hypothetical protein